MNVHLVIERLAQGVADAKMMRPIPVIPPVMVTHGLLDGSAGAGGVRRQTGTHDAVRRSGGGDRS